MRGVLIYNPVSGTKREYRAVQVDAVAAELQNAGYDLQIIATTHRGSAGAQASEAIADGAEVVFACGGDGTVHDVLQGVVGSAASLAVIPMGSGNALSRELKIPLDPLQAAGSYAKTRCIEIRLGRCASAMEERAFLFMAGAGPAGSLMYRMLAVNRSRWGRWAYAMHALRLLARGSFRSFAVRYEIAEGVWAETQAVSAMAMRVGSLGGIFPGIARGASLRAPTMRLVLVKAPALIGLPLWFVMNWFGLERWNPLLLRADVTAFECIGEGVHAQIDGEWFGKLPMNVALTDQTVRLLVPERGRSIRD